MTLDGGAGRPFIEAANDERVRDEHPSVVLRDLATRRRPQAHVIAFANEKGGVGKSTLAFHCAVALAHRGHAGAGGRLRPAAADRSTASSRRATAPRARSRSRCRGRATSCSTSRAAPLLAQEIERARPRLRLRADRPRRPGFADRAARDRAGRHGGHAGQLLADRPRRARPDQPGHAPLPRKPGRSPRSSPRCAPSGWRAACRRSTGSSPRTASAIASAA